MCRYAATTHVVGAFPESLRQESAAEHVRVSLVEPSLVRTELTERDDLGAVDIPDTEFGVPHAADVADAIVYVVTRPARAAISRS